MRQEKNFWISESNKQPTIPIPSLKKFLQANGFFIRRHSLNNYELLRIQNSIIENVDSIIIRDFLTNYCTENNYDDGLLAVELDHPKLEKKYVKILELFEINQEVDTSKIAKFFFRNGVVFVSQDNIEIKPYSEIENLVWRSQIIDFDIDLTVGREGIFQQFLINIGGKNISSLVSGIGYMLHRYKTPATNQALVLYDEKSNDYQANGGTGKSLVAIAIGKLRELAIKDGKIMRLNSRFFYQDVERSTEVLLIDDPIKEFSFEQIFPILTTGIVVEKKYQQSFTIPFNKSPKVIIASNYPVRGPIGFSTERRKFEVELTSHYGPHLSPEEEFGGLMFDDWDKIEWNKFYITMFHSVQYYLKNGLVPTKKLDHRKVHLARVTSSEFAEFAEMNFFEKTELVKDVLHQKFNSNYSDVSAHQFHKWMKMYGMINGRKMHERKSNGRYILNFE